MSTHKASAVVFAYHNVGVRCLSALLAQGVDVRLVITHNDNPAENVWFESVESLAHKSGIKVIKPDDPNQAVVIDEVMACQPDFLFSFYYRNMLGSELLAAPTKGAYNMHGSLLPKYRGRVPINWAIIEGETQAGATLHRMEIKPDAGAIIDQETVPILINDTAQDVFIKVTCAAEILLLRAVPALLAGSAHETPMNLSAGSYFSGRKPKDGQIDWHQPALRIHNLIRAVAPPYPGAFFDVEGKDFVILGSFFRDLAAKSSVPALYYEEGFLYADCYDGRRFMITHCVYDDHELTESDFTRLFGGRLEIKF
jgi:methionyl-tRNA formyltransferase